MSFGKGWRRYAIGCLTIVSLAFAGALQFACDAAAHAQAKPYAKKGEWTVEIIPDQSGRSSFCRAKRPYGTETWLAFSQGKSPFAIEFSGEGSLAAGDKYAVQFWIDKPRPEGPTSTFAQKVDDPNDYDFMRIAEGIDDIGDIDLLMNGKVLHIRSHSQNWRYDLRGANAALKSMFECKDRVILGQGAPAVAQAAPPPTAPAPAAPAPAEGRPVNCELTVRGRTYIKGVCQFRGTGGGGFQISGGDYFAQVNVTGPGVADASWNEDPDSTHAQAPLGTVTRKGACWVGANATVCARDLPPQQTRVAAAAQPDGASLFPDLPGASGACIGAAGRLESGERLVLRNCRVPTDNIFIRRPDGSLGIAKRPDLCLDVDALGMLKSPRLIVTACKRDQRRWDTGANATTSGDVRRQDAMCLTIPQTNDPNARFPFFITIAPCDDVGGSSLKFFLSKG